MRRAQTDSTRAGSGEHRARVARAIRHARRLAQLDHAEFAAMLRSRLEEDGEPADEVTGEAVAAWECGLDAPSATALLAAADLASVEPELLFSRPPVLKRLESLEQQLQWQSVQLDGLQRRLRSR